MPQPGGQARPARRRPRGMKSECAGMKKSSPPPTAHLTLLLVFLLAGLAGCGSRPAPQSSTPVAAATPTAPPTPTPAPYMQIPGVYLGTFHGTKSSSVDLFAKTGKGAAISAAYLNWSSGFNNGFLNANAYVGRISFLTWEFLPGASKQTQEYEGRVLEAITDGQYDDYLDSWAKGMVSFGRPVFLRFGHEMNGDWYPWSGAKNGGGTLDGYGSPDLPDGPERYVAAYRYIHDRFTRAGAENVLWVWCPNAPFASMEQSLGPWNRAAAYYPGDDYVDWMCFDGYNWGSSAFGQSFNARWTSFDDIFASSYQELQEINPGKPIVIGEFASTEEGGSKAEWIRDAYGAICTRYPQIRGVIWFHIAKETDWRINSSEAGLAAYRDAVAADCFLDTWPDFAP
jgi:beta-mannanase